MSFTQHRDSQQKAGESSLSSSRFPPGLRQPRREALREPLRERHSMKYQRGMGLWSVFAIVAVAVFMGMFAFKVGPHYMENWTVSKIASDVASNPDLLKQPRSKVYSYIGNAYRTNNLWDLVPQDSIKLKKDGKRGYVVTVQYEKRDTLIRNIDVVTSFNKEVSSVQ